MQDTRGAVKVQGQKVKGQNHNVTQRISIKKRYNSGTDKLSKVKLGEHYPRAERNTLHGVQGH